MPSQTPETIEKVACDRTELRNRDIFEFVEEVNQTQSLPTAESDKFDGSVDVTITSPPYAALKDYGYDKDAQVGHDPYDTYLDELREIFRAVYDVTAEDGTLWVVANTVKEEGQLLDLPFDIADVCQNLNAPYKCPECQVEDIEVPLQERNDHSGRFCVNCGYEELKEDDSWILQDVVIWDKERALPYSQKGSFRNVFEYILCFSKTDDFTFNLDRIRIADPSRCEDWWVSYPERYHPRGKLPENIWEFLTPTQGWTNNAVDHPAPFPRGMVERIVRLTTDKDDLVFDPFAGSGTVLAQAGVMNRNALGYELSEDYCELYPEVLSQIADEWAQREATADSIRKQQEEFEQLIGSLRQIRYCREFLRTFAKKRDIDVDELPITAVFHHSDGIHNRTESGSCFIDASFAIVVDESRVNPENIAEEVRDTLERPPCSKFGISPSLDVVTISDACDNPDDYQLPSNCFVYTDGHHNVFESRVGQATWKDELKPEKTVRPFNSKYPPILSNLGLKVPDPRRHDSSDISLSDVTYEVTTIEDEVSEQKVAPKVKISHKAAD